MTQSHIIRNSTIKQTANAITKQNTDTSADNNNNKWSK